MNQRNPGSDFKAGYCAIVGIPNVGKSTLLNALLGTKLSIVTRKPQTTRKRVLGIYSSDREQIVFLDTPGIMPRPTTLLHQTMLRDVRRSFGDADVILVLAEANVLAEKAFPSSWDEYIKAAAGKPMILALSKTDLLGEKKALFPILQAYGDRKEFLEIIPLSAKTGYNLKELVATLRKHLPAHQQLFDPEQLSDQQDRFFVAEFIREAIFQKFKEEIPYSTEVQIAEFKERRAGKWFIDANIIVERDSQKAILIGRNGEALKSLGTTARREIERFLAMPVYLELHVKTKRDWRQDKQALAEFGYHE